MPSGRSWLGTISYWSDPKGFCGCGVVGRFALAKLQRLVPMRKRHLGMLLSIGIMLAATATSITGCGKKGPLYLPDATQQQSDSEQSEKKSKKQKQ